MIVVAKATMYILTVISLTGEKVNTITGGPSDSIAVYGEADLNRRLKLAARDPRQLKITVKRCGDHG